MSKRVVARIFVCLCFMSGMGTSTSWALPQDTAFIPKLSKAPKIDGRINDACYREAYSISNFANYKTGEPVEEKTTLYLGYDKDNLYLAFHCKESQMDKTRARETERDGLKIFGDDCIEIFLDTNFDRSSYYHLVFNLSGTKYDAKNMQGGARDISFNPKWKIAADNGKDFWSAEAAIPFAGMGMSAPSDGTKWSANFFRSAFPRKEISNWTYVTKSAHTPSEFGTVIFGDYRAALKGTISDLEKKIKQAELRIKDLPKNESTKANLRLKDMKKRVSALSGLLEKETFSPELWSAFNNEASSISYSLVKLIHGKEGFTVWYKNPMIQLTPSDKPEGVEELKSIELTGYVDQYISTAFVVSNMGKDTLNTRIIFSELKNENKRENITPKRIQLRTASFIKIITGKVIADPLPLMNEANELTLPHDEPRQVWLTIDARNLTPGRYTGRLIIRPSYGAKEKILPVNLNLCPIQIEKNPIDFWAFSGLDHWLTVYNATTNWTEETISKYLEDLKEHGCNRTTIFTYKLFPIYDGEGNIIHPLDPKRLEHFNKMVSRRKGYGKIMINNYFGRHMKFGIKYLSPVYKKIFKIWLMAFVKNLKEQGIGYDDFYLSLADEACSEHIAKLYKFVREEVDPEIKFYTFFFRQPVEAVKPMLPYIDLWINHYRGPWYHNKDRRGLLDETKKPVWIYDSVAGTKQLSPTGFFRVKGWMAWRHNLDGLAHWLYDLSCNPGLKGGSPTGPDPWLSHDYGQVVYFFLDWSRGPVTSRRWEAYREGLYDYAYMDMLWGIVEKAKEKGLNTERGEELLSQFNERANESGIYDYLIDIAKETVRLNEQMPFTVSSPAIKVKGKRVKISWKTSEPCSGRVYYRKDQSKEMKKIERLADLWYCAATEKLSTEITSKLDNPDKLSREIIITIDNLTAGDYTFYISSANENGYIIMKDNKGKFYHFLIK